MKGNQNIRIILTATVLLVGGYFIQKSVSTSDLSTSNILSEVVDGAHADVGGK